MLDEGAAERDRGRRFARRVWPMRVLGLGLGFFCLAGPLLENGAPRWMLLLAAGNCFLWPHLAYRLAARSVDPVRAEFRNLLVDSAAGGAWIAAMQFNLVPSMLFFTMLSIDKVAAGGWPLLFRSWLAMAAGLLAAGAGLGFALQPVSSMPVVFASIPFLVAYPLALSLVSYHLGRQVSRQNRQLETFNRIDGLSGVANRLHWEETAALELRRFRRTGKAAVLMMLDIDHFKAINDRFGHLVGDEVIKGFALELRAALREIDTPGRYGGDEFGVVMPETGPEGARQAANRLLLQARRRSADPDTAVPYTLSIGFAAASREMNDVGAWIAAADAALYRAKQAGRDTCSD